MNFEHIKLKNICIALICLYSFFALLCWTIGNKQFRFSHEDYIDQLQTDENTEQTLINYHTVVQILNTKDGFIKGVEIAFRKDTALTDPIKVDIIDVENNCVYGTTYINDGDFTNEWFAYVEFDTFINLHDIPNPALRVTCDADDKGQHLSVLYNVKAGSSSTMLIDRESFSDSELVMKISLAYESPWYYFYAFLFILLFIGLVVYSAVLIRYEKEGRQSYGLNLYHAFKKYSFLLKQLIERDFKIKYKRSVLGIVWSFLNPLLMMLVQYIVFSNLFKWDVEYYAVYLLSGIVLYSGFSEMTSTAMNAITGNANLITKVYVPKYIYPISKVLSSSINMLLSLIPLLLVAIITGVKMRVSLLLLPYGIICFILFIMGVSFALTSFMVYFRDIQFLWGVFTTIWMYITPIMYPINILPDYLLSFERFNPLYIYISYVRNVLIDGLCPDPKQIAACLMYAIMAMIIGGWIFKKTEKNFVLYI